MRRWILALLILISGATAFGATCSVAATGVAFGEYQPRDRGRVESSGRVTVSCSGIPGERVTYSLSLLNTSSSVQGGRALLRQGHSLRYQLFLDTARTQLWGDGTSATSVIKDTITIPKVNWSQDYFVYGRMMGEQSDAVEGSYVDRLIITLMW
jgi:spore coat protein U-like protein